MWYCYKQDENTEPGWEALFDITIIKTKSAVMALTLVLFLLNSMAIAQNQPGFTNALDYGFSPGNTGIENTKALQRALDQKGTIIVSVQGEYKIGGTVFIGSNTTLIFGNGVTLKKVNEKGAFTHVILNKGALSKTFNENIVIEGLHLKENKVTAGMDLIYGLRGNLAFFYAKKIKIERFRLLDLDIAQFGIHVCKFEDLIIDDVEIRGDKDGIHLGVGKRFTIRNGVFQTYDDAIALNAQDYAASNPEMGWIEDGLIENCYDLDDDKEPVGYFSRILAGAWVDWYKGIKVRSSDAVVHDGRIYRVMTPPSLENFESLTPPTHKEGQKVIDGINWGATQKNAIYTAGVKNVTFRNIHLEKDRISFSFHFDNGKWSRSYYPGAQIPQQGQFVFDNIIVKHDAEKALFNIGTPVNVITLSNSSINNNVIRFVKRSAIKEYLKTKINLVGNTFNVKGDMVLFYNELKGKEFDIKTTASIEVHDDFNAKLVPGDGRFNINSDISSFADLTNHEMLFVDNNVSFAEAQYANMVADNPNPAQIPRTMNKGRLRKVGIYDWTSGFFAGSLWYLYELSGNKKWKDEAIRYTEALEPVQHFTRNHDIGFMMYCSYGNGLRLTGNKKYETVLKNSASSLRKRYSNKVKAIKSWNGGKSLDGEHEWQFPVIVDNMMNLELLFYASNASNNPEYKNIAINHADQTMETHYRSDYSSYHVVDFDSISGQVRGKYTAQGYADETAWARGQAWGLYGFVMCYKQSGKIEYLKHAEKIATYLMDHPNCPEDRIPLWDYYANDKQMAPVWKEKLPQMIQQPRDASAAAIMCSAFLDLSKVKGEDKNGRYYNTAREILYSLSKNYKVKPEVYPYFILDKCVGNMPRASEVSVPINYGDYYFLESLVKYKRMVNGNSSR